MVQDTHVFDLLEPKEQEVLVLEDAHGKTNLKGLSKVYSTLKNQPLFKLHRGLQKSYVCCVYHKFSFSSSEVSCPL